MKLRLTTHLDNEMVRVVRGWLELAVEVNISANTEINVAVDDIEKTIHNPYDEFDHDLPAPGLLAISFISQLFFDFHCEKEAKLLRVFFGYFFYPRDINSSLELKILILF